MTSLATTADFEKAFWGDCTNTIGEEIKQLVYAHKMGLDRGNTWRSTYNYDLKGKRVIDIGGGPVSLLLKCLDAKGCAVLDPIRFPAWVYSRYQAAGIETFIMRGEDILPVETYDEAWIYNVLQHVDDPLKVIANARGLAKKIRMFEWVDIPPYPGHPHMLTRAMLEGALERKGAESWMNESGCYGRAFYGSWGY